MRTSIRSILSRLRILFESIRFRLTLWFVAILALVLAVFSVFVYTLQSRDLTRQTVDRLESKIRQIQSLDQNAREPFERQVTIPDISQNAGPLLGPDDVLAVTDTSGRVVQEYGPITSGDVNQLADIGIKRSASAGPFTYTLVSTTAPSKSAAKGYLFVVAPISVRTQVIGLLILGTPVDPTGQLHRLLLTLVLGAAGMLVIALAGGYWLADRAMRPVKTITLAAQQISETDLSRRLNLGRQDELGKLADTFDQMLARLQAAFDRQRQFTADASHELRTPLTIVNLEASRALDGKRSREEYQQALGLIQSENEFMSRLVNNLLTLSRMDAGQTVLAMETLDLSDLALEAVERLAPIAARKQVELSTGELPELTVSGDRQFLTQMITNLVENAIKYTRGTEKCVRVETGSATVEDKAVAWLRVTDNGPGIPAEHMPHIFDRFYRLDKARSRDSEDSGGGPAENSETVGSGLGLSIARWIARANGGEINVMSEVGKGSTFEVRLPLLEKDPPIQISS
jgi:signal transduction histidine kinase